MVGANTVNGPSPESVSTRPAAFTAATSVVRFFACDAFSTIVFCGSIGAPPTIGMSEDMAELSCAKVAGVMARLPAATRAATAVVRISVWIMIFSLYDLS